MYFVNLTIFFMCIREEDMAEYHVGCGLAGIYAGVLKNKDEWKDKTECTDEAIEAVRDYMVDDLLGGISCSKTDKSGYSWKLKDGRYVILEVRIEE
jgi:hypothetical protein